MSTLGNIRHKQSGKLRTINYDRLKKQRRRAEICVIDENYDRQTICVARAVLSAFDPVSGSYKLDPIHIDSNKYNNKLSNLRWSKLYNLRVSAHIDIMQYCEDEIQDKVWRYFDGTGCDLRTWERDLFWYDIPEQELDRMMKIIQKKYPEVEMHPRELDIDEYTKWD